MAHTLRRHYREYEELLNRLERAINAYEQTAATVRGLRFAKKTIA